MDIRRHIFSLSRGIMITNTVAVIIIITTITATIHRASTWFLLHSRDQSLTPRFYPIVSAESECSA